MDAGTFTMGAALVAEGAVLALVVWLVGRTAAERMAYRRLRHRRVLVNTDTGRTFTGVVWQQRGPLLVLRNVTARDNGRELPMDGELVVERHRVDFVQVLP